MILNDALISLGKNTHVELMYSNPATNTYNCITNEFDSSKKCVRLDSFDFTPYVYREVRKMKAIGYNKVRIYI